jgi:hypothetical protein
MIDLMVILRYVNGLVRETRRWYCDTAAARLLLQAA